MLINYDLIVYVKNLHVKKWCSTLNFLALIFNSLKKVFVWQFQLVQLFYQTEPRPFTQLYELLWENNGHMTAPETCTCKPTHRT